MNSRISLLAAFLLFSFSPVVAQPPPEIRPIAVGGKVELHSIQLRRSIVAREGVPSDSASLEIHLWLPSPGMERKEGTMLRLAELEPIKDNSGKLLSTEWALRDLDCHFEWVRSSSHIASGERWGPVLRLPLAAPVREATKIASIKGKAIVARPKLTAMGFPAPKQFVETNLDHPLLKDFPIQATRKPDGELDSLVNVVLKVPRRHARIVEWGLARKGSLLRDQAAAIDHLEGRMTKFYKADETEDALLAIVVADPIEEEVFEFEFKDVALP